MISVGSSVYWSTRRRGLVAKKRGRWENAPKYVYTYVHLYANIYKHINTPKLPGMILGYFPSFLRTSESSFFDNIRAQAFCSRSHRPLALTSIQKMQLEKDPWRAEVQLPIQELMRQIARGLAPHRMYIPGKSWEWYQLLLCHNVWMYMYKDTYRRM